MKTYALIGPALMLFCLPTAKTTCETRVERVDCGRKDDTLVYSTCESSANATECSCIFDNPLRSEKGWLKTCRTKNSLKLGRKKVSKRQVAGGEDICGAIQPPKPGRVSCKLSPREIRCTGTCDLDHEFIDGVSEQNYFCVYSDGIWKPSRSFPACKPKCDPACENGGNCTAVHYCSCPNDFRGDACQYPLTLCSISKNEQPSNWQCNHTRAGTTCDISCRSPGSDGVLEPHRYECSPRGVWSQILPPCVQISCGDPGDIPYGRRNASGRPLPVGSSVAYECTEKFNLVGQAVVTCQRDGHWSATKPRCVAIGDYIPTYCPTPNAPKNSIVHVSFPNQHSLRTILSSEISLSQKLFTIHFSQRQAKDISALPEGTFVIGSRVQYKCKSQFYKLYGSEYQTCTSSGTWTGHQPACIPDCGKSDSPKTPFVINGNSTRLGQWPWQVGLAVITPQGLMLLCGGVLISEQWVLTAAHCITKNKSNVPRPASDFLVFCGKYYRDFDKDDEYVQVRKLYQMIVHTEYDFIHFDDDIALLQLEGEVELTFRVRPICLPTEDTTRENVRDGKKGIVLGWGLTENGRFSDTLLETILPVVGHDRCEEAYREGLRTVTITQNMFCAGYETGFSDTCSGDSGGPFMFSVGPPNNKRWYLEGIVSWGSGSSCGKAHHYSGFTKVGRFMPWINMFI